MKKAIPLFLLASLMLFTGCFKPTDFDDLKHLDTTAFRLDGIEMGQVGFPVGHTSLNVSQLLAQWQNPSCTFVNDADGFITVCYEDVFPADITFPPTTPALAPKYDILPHDTTFTKTLSGSTEIDLFNEMPNSDSLYMPGVYADVRFFLKGVYNPDTILSKYIDNPYITDLDIYLDINGDNQSTLHLSNLLSTTTIPLDSIRKGCTITLSDKVNITEIINDMRPSRLHYSMKLVIPLRTGSLTLADFARFGSGDPRSYLANCVRLEELQTTTYVKANFPFKMLCKNLTFSREIDLSYENLRSAFDEIDKRLGLGDKTYMVFHFDNNIPLQFRVFDTLVDASGNPLFFANHETASLFKQGSIINPAIVGEKSSADGPYFYSKETAESDIAMQINHSNIEQLHAATKVRIAFKLSTSQFNNVALPTIFRSTDKLDGQIYMLINPDTKNHPAFKDFAK